MQALYHFPFSPPPKALRGKAAVMVCGSINLKSIECFLHSSVQGQKKRGVVTRRYLPGITKLLCIGSAVRIWWVVAGNRQRS